MSIAHEGAIRGSISRQTTSKSAALQKSGVGGSVDLGNHSKPPDLDSLSGEAPAKADQPILPAWWSQDTLGDKGVLTRSSRGFRIAL